MSQGPAAATGATDASARRLFVLGLVGPACLVAAAACAFLAAKAPLELPLGAYALQLLPRDLGGLALVAALAGGAFLAASTWLWRRRSRSQRVPTVARFLAVAALVFLPLFVIALVVWPAPPIRLAFVPAAAEELVGYRLWVRGNQHGPAPLAAWGRPMLVESAERPGVPLTCDFERTAEFGPFGWARFLSVADAGAAASKPAIGVVARVPSSCHEGIDLARVSDDPRARELLEPFVFENSLDIDGADVDAAEGHPERSLIEPSSIGRYLVFKRSPEAADAAPDTSGQDALQRRGAGYGGLDHVLAIYRCDRDYAAFLEKLGAHVPPDLMDLAVALARPGADPALLDLRDESSWRMRLGPVASLQGAERKLAVSKPLSDPACAELFAFYRGLPTPSRRP